jgi:hypothetical protein
MSYSEPFSLFTKQPSSSLLNPATTLQAKSNSTILIPRILSLPLRSRFLQIRLPEMPESNCPYTQDPDSLNELKEFQEKLIKSCEEIRDIFEKKRESMENIDYEFLERRIGKNRQCFLHKMRGPNYQLIYNELEIESITILEGILDISHRSFPTYYLYVGDNSDKNKNIFNDGSKHINPTRERIYLKYSPNPQVKDALNLYNDHGYGKYYPANIDKGEPSVVKTKEIYQAFIQWLNNNVLAEINSAKANSTGMEILMPEKNSQNRNLNSERKQTSSNNKPLFNPLRRSPAMTFNY